MVTKVCEQCGDVYKYSDNLICWKCYYRNNRESRLAAVKKSYKKHREKTKKIVFSHYGNCCAYCQVTENLQIDHMNGDGAEQRRKMFGNNRTCDKLYKYLIDNGFPAGYQTLCARCNWAKNQMTDQEFRVWIKMMYEKLH